jgi:hypothetical protein
VQEGLHLRPGGGTIPHMVTRSMFTSGGKWAIPLVFAACGGGVIATAPLDGSAPEVGARDAEADTPLDASMPDASTPLDSSVIGDSAADTVLQNDGPSDAKDDCYRNIAFGPDTGGYAQVIGKCCYVIEDCNPPGPPPYNVCCTIMINATEGACRLCQGQ